MANNELLYKHLNKNMDMLHFFTLVKTSKYIEITPTEQFEGTFRNLQLSIAKGDLYGKDIFIKCTSVRIRWNGYVFGRVKYFTLSQLDEMIANVVNKLPKIDRQTSPINNDYVNVSDNEM